MSYIVELHENNYPDEHGTCMLLGIYPTKEAAIFISKIVKNKYKLDQFPIVYETNLSVTTDKVENFILKTKSNENYVKIK